MISCEDLYEIFKKKNLLFFTGVPDSTFKSWMSFLDDNHGIRLQNIVACNECEAIAIASGYHMATKGMGVVYMQNSGLGKTVNPLTSLADPKVYSIPLLLMIGWRGEPGIKDEPQHVKMGEITLSLLDTLNIPYEILPDNRTSAEAMINAISNLALEKNRPVALIIKKRILEDYIPREKKESRFEMNREDAIKIIVDNLPKNSIVVSTTGKTSRELFEYRIAKKEQPRDFYTVGSMGCSASIAHGIALQKKDRKVFVFDGDGAVLMQMGALGTIGHYKTGNLYHLVFDNRSYDSTGGQPTVANTINFAKIALASGYTSAEIVQTSSELKNQIQNTQLLPGPKMIVVRVNPGARKDLGRPTTTPIENKKAFIDLLNKI